MEQINKFKWWIIAGIIIVILFCVDSCVGKQIDQLHGENKILKEQITQAKDGLKVSKQERLRLKDSIRAENAKKEQKIKEQDKVIAESKDRIAILERKTSKAKEIAKNKSYEAVADTLNVIYGGKNAVATANSVDMKSSLPNQILETIIDANECSEIVKEKDIQLVAKDSVIGIKDGQLKDSALNLFSAEKEIKKHEELDKLQTDLNKNLEKENKKLRTKSWINKILIPVGVTIGAFVGYSVAK